MIDATADGGGRPEDSADRQIEVKIEHLSGIASMTCPCHRYVDLLPSTRGRERRHTSALGI